VNNTILEKQTLLQKGYKEDPSEIKDKTVGEVYDYIQSMQTYMNMEITEILSSLANDNMKIHKPWSSQYKKLRDKKIWDKDNTSEEAIDALCFMLNIVIAAGVTPDNIEDLYTRVYNKNISRQNDKQY